MNTTSKKKIRLFLDLLGNEFWLGGVPSKKKRLMSFMEFVEATGGITSIKKTAKIPIVDDNDRHDSD